MMEACIFDLDGTLTDTLDSLTYSVNATLQEMGLSQITRDECRQYVGDGARCLMERSLKRTGEENIRRLDEGMEVYGRIFDEHCTYLVKPYEGITQMLQELGKRGIKLGVLSNKPHQQTKKVVQEIFGDGIFDYVQGQKDGIPKKPDPAGVLELLEKMKVTKDACLYVGDSEVDVRTGKNAGVKTVSVSWGFRTREVLASAGADHMIDQPQDLLQFL
jgi:phosphoglycolate phosphatase